MITEHIELPDPTKYRKVAILNVGLRSEGKGYAVVTYKVGDTQGNDPLFLAATNSLAEAVAIHAEMQQRIDVVRALLK